MSAGVGAVGRALARAALVGALLTGCSEIAKVATAANANHLRQSTREVCAELAAADRAAGLVLDAPDAGTP